MRNKRIEIEPQDRAALLTLQSIDERIVGNSVYPRREFQRCIKIIYVLEGAFPKTDKDSKESEISLYYDLDSQAVGKIVIGGEFARDIIIKGIGMGVLVSDR